MTGEDILDALFRELLVEGRAVPDTAAPGAAASKRHFLRTLMNIRPLLPARLGDHTAKDPSKTSIVLQGHEGRIYAVAIGPDNHYLVTTSDDHTARLWTLRLDDLLDRACRAAGRNLTREEWAQYVPAGRYHKTFHDLPRLEEGSGTVAEKRASTDHELPQRREPARPLLLAAHISPALRDYRGSRRQTTAPSSQAARGHRASLASQGSPAATATD